MPGILIGFYSKGRRAGKDTAAAFIREWCVEEGLRSFERRAFADIPKLLVAEILGIRGRTTAEIIQQVDEFKLKGVVAWSADGRMPPGQHIAGRDFIINLCGPLGETERGGARKLFGESFWTDMALPSDWQPEAQVTVVTDVRAEDEATRIAELGGQVVEIVNPRAEAAGGRSERGLSPDLIHAQIWNGGSLEEFRDSVQAYTQILWRRLH